MRTVLPAVAFVLALYAVLAAVALTSGHAFPVPDLSAIGAALAAAPDAGRAGRARRRLAVRLFTLAGELAGDPRVEVARYSLRGLAATAALRLGLALYGGGR